LIRLDIEITGKLEIKDNDREDDDEDAATVIPRS